jgi:hypothetical protein
VSVRRQPDAPDRTGPPAPLVVAASLVAVEGVLLLFLGVLELRSLTADRASMAVTVALFFLLYGVGLLLCARAVTRGQSWARSPIVLAQLIQLGVAWNYRDGATTGLAVGLAVVAVVVVAGLLHPASVEALAERPEHS